MKATIVLIGLCVFAAAWAGDLHTDAATQPASPDSLRGVAVQYYGVSACGVKVFWLVFADGHMVRLDAEHHPKDFDGFMRSIAQLPHDLVEIPCASNL